jgi:putative spermidine/putrescine transport system ATP-binding protein
VDDKEITDLPPNKRNVGMVFQAYALFPNMTVVDNVGFGLRIEAAGADRQARRQLLEMINMPRKADRYPYQLGRPAACRAGPRACDRAAVLL